MAKRTRKPSQSELARARGVSRQAAHKAAKRGQLEGSDLRGALETWAASGQRAKRSESLTEASMEVQIERAMSLRVATAAKLGELVLAVDVSAEWDAMVLAAREKLLSLPSKALQLGLVDGPGEDALVELVDEALAELAAKGTDAQRIA